MHRNVNGNNELCELAGNHVDDIVHTGDATFEAHIETTLRKSRQRIYDNFTFAGIEVKTDKKGIVVHQTSKADLLTVLPKDAQYYTFCSRRMQVQWLVHTRPEVACASAQSAQVTSEQYDDKCVQVLNSTIRTIKSMPTRGLVYRKLDKESVHLRVYSDSSFANNRDGTSQLGFIILLCDYANACNVVHYRSYKSQRVVRSVLGADLYA